MMQPPPLTRMETFVWQGPFSCSPGGHKVRSSNWAVFKLSVNKVCNFPVRRMETAKTICLSTIPRQWEQTSFWKSLGIFFFSVSPCFPIPLWWTFSLAQKSAAIPDRSTAAILKILPVCANVYSHIFDLASSEKCNICFCELKSVELVRNVKNTLGDWPAKIHARNPLGSYCSLGWPQHTETTGCGISPCFVSVVGTTCT